MLGTLLALMGLARSKPCRHSLRGYVNLRVSSARTCNFLVLLSSYWGLAHRSELPIAGHRPALIMLTLFEAAYFRNHASRNPVDPRGQTGAGYAIGRWEIIEGVYYIVLPQAFRNMLPVMLTQTIILFKIHLSYMSFR